MDVGPRATADFLFKFPASLPPKSPHYGAVTSRFRVSNVYTYGDGKKWQLRTICYRGNHYIVPFVLNSGGVNPRHPIIGTPLLRKIGALPDGIDRAAFENKGRVTIPSPMGELRNFQDWDLSRMKHEDLDERFNLIGHGWARYAFELHRVAKLARKRVPRDLLIDDLVAEPPRDITPVDRAAVELELDVLISIVGDDRPMDVVAAEWAGARC